MQIKVHLSGVAIASEPIGGKNPSPFPSNSRYQGSLYSQQKRAIADAVEWMRLYGSNKPIFFVATSPGFVKAEHHAEKISKFTHNLRNTYGCVDYVWVRELTSSGCPHYHFVADMPFIQSPVNLSLYWSRLFGSGAKNSIRLGSAPINGQRKFYVDSSQASRYISKYIGKDLEVVQNNLLEAGYPCSVYKKSYRSFAISERARLMSKPVVYQANYHFAEREAINYTDGDIVKTVTVRQYIDRTFENDIGEYMNPHNYRWKRIEPHNIFIGFQDKKD